MQESESRDHPTPCWRGRAAALQTNPRCMQNTMGICEEIPLTAWASAAAERTTRISSYSRRVNSSTILDCIICTTSTLPPTPPGWAILVSDPALLKIFYIFMTCKH